MSYDYTYAYVRDYNKKFLKNTNWVEGGGYSLDWRFILSKNIRIVRVINNNTIDSEDIKNKHGLYLIHGWMIGFDCSRGLGAYIILDNINKNNII